MGGLLQSAEWIRQPFEPLFSRLEASEKDVLRIHLLCKLSIGEGKEAEDMCHYSLRKAS
jgi:hypothetical protein